MMHRRVGRHIGNRGAALGLLGLIWILYASGMIAGDPAPIRGLPDERWDLWLRAGVWLAPGAVAIVAALWRRIDALAWGLVIVPIALRMLSNVFGWLTGAYAAGWRGALIFLAFGLMIFFCARGLDRPPAWNGIDRRRAR